MTEDADEELSRVDDRGVEEDVELATRVELELAAVEDASCEVEVLEDRIELEGVTTLDVDSDVKLELDTATSDEIEPVATTEDDFIAESTVELNEELGADDNADGAWVAATDFDMDTTVEVESACNSKLAADVDARVALDVGGGTTVADDSFVDVASEATELGVTERLALDTGFKLELDVPRAMFEVAADLDVDRASVEEECSFSMDEGDGSALGLDDAGATLDEWDLLEVVRTLEEVPVGTREDGET